MRPRALRGVLEGRTEQDCALAEPGLCMVRSGNKIALSPASKLDSLELNPGSSYNLAEHGINLGAGC